MPFLILGILIAGLATLWPKKGDAELEPEYPLVPQVYAPAPSVTVTTQKNPAIYGPDASGQPRGIRNNNPGNIRESGAWEGNVGNDDKGFEKFDTPEHGIRALTIVLYHSYFAKGINTVRGIVELYAPKTDSNDPESYAKDVAAALQVGQYDALSFNIYSYRLMLAIGNVEQGKPLTAWYSLATINDGYDAGLHSLGFA